MKVKRYLINIYAFLLAAAMTAGCTPREKTVPDPKNPTVITVWHAYNAFAKTVFDKKVTEFNETVGMEQGIVVDTYGYGSSEELDEALFYSANNMIGSEPLPNICSVYPDSAYRLDQLAPLVALDQYFSAEELSEYRTEFLEEGIWGDGASPKLVPVSKSTELLYLNKTDWESFSAQTGVSEEALKTWEGLLMAAGEYYRWSGGQAFLGINSYNNFAVLSAVQLGEDPFSVKEGKPVFSYSRETARKAWDHYYVPHIKGWYKSNVYNQDGIKSGNLLAYIGSSGGAGYFPDKVIVDENQGYPIECGVYAYPTFEGAPKYMTQRGADMGIFSSDPLHEYASAEFLKWFTDPQQNVKFTGAIGYIPVENEALSSIPELIKWVQDSDNSDAVKKSVTAAVEAMERGKFYIKKTFPNSYEADALFDGSLDSKIALDLDELHMRTEKGESREAVIEELLHEDNFNNWYSDLMLEMAGKLDE